MEPNGQRIKEQLGTRDVSVYNGQILTGDSLFVKT